MGGTNPYIEKPAAELPQKPYKVTFHRPDGPAIVFEVDPAKLPYGPTGLPGSILDIALNGGAAGLDLEHACGGVCACSTCHVKVVWESSSYSLREPAPRRKGSSSRMPSRWNLMLFSSVRSWNSCVSFLAYRPTGRLTSSRAFR